MAQLILIPGLAGDTRMWRHQLEDLKDFTPVVTDAGGKNPTIESMAAGLLAQHPGELILCGASMGGMIAMEAVRQAPSRIRALALLGTSARPETDDMRKLREDAIVLFGQGRVEEVIRPNVDFAFHPKQAADPSLVAAYLDFVLDAGAQALIQQNRAVIARPDARLHLSSVRCPTLVMCGDSDQLTPHECAREIASLVPGAKLVTVPQCGHMLTMEKPELVSATLRAWLATLTG